MMTGFHDLYFEKVPIPAHLAKDLKKLKFISEDGGTTCRRFLLLLAQTCQVQILQNKSIKDGGSTAGLAPCNKPKDQKSKN